MTQPQSIERYLNQIGVFCTFSNQAQDYTKSQEKTTAPTVGAVAQQKKTAAPIQVPVTPKTLQQSIVQPIKNTLQHCKTLEDLRKAVDDFHDCHLRKTATNTVFCDGNPNAPIMVIGEAPGAEEDLQGKPFVGQSGQLVDKMFQTIGLNRAENLYITNNVFWRPPANRVPSDLELEQCYPYLERHILIHKPKAILLLGGVAVKNILKTDLGITKLRDRENTFTHPELENPIPVFVFYHPAYLLRSPRQKGAFWHDLLRLKKFLIAKNILPFSMEKAC
ncbi:MAG: hypothetical protein NEHIOOID_00637 [Holosporales bacterium]